jgi:hypothetical protein
MEVLILKTALHGCWEGFQERVLRLYEQNAPPELIRQRIGDYVRRWKRMVR